jgi:hypothetical protein
VFELELDGPPKVGELLTELTMVYEVVRVLPDDTMIEVEWRAGPTTVGSDAPDLA